MPDTVNDEISLDSQYELVQGFSFRQEPDGVTLISAPNRMPFLANRTAAQILKALSESHSVGEIITDITAGTELTGREDIQADVVGLVRTLVLEHYLVPQIK